MLELNARPGLNIQIANHCGLNTRLKAVEKLEGLEEMDLQEKIAAGGVIAGTPAAN